MYRVVKFFTDLHDNDYPYSVGDVFPRAGVGVGAGRIAELAGSNNRQGCPLIEKVVEAPEEEVVEAPVKPARKKKATKE